MGQKVSPISNRLPLDKTWDSLWFAKDKSKFRFNLIEDIKLRQMIFDRYSKAAVKKVAIRRTPAELVVDIHTARPGIIIGRAGQGLVEFRLAATKIVSTNLKINVIEVRSPDLSAQLVADSIAHQITRRMPFRRVAKQTLARVSQSGAKGVKIVLAGRLGGKEIARVETFKEGSIPLGTLKKKVDFARVQAQTSYGTIGVKVWIYSVDKTKKNVDDADSA